MVLALRAWKFDPRRILRATRDITPPSTFLPPPPSPFNRRKLFARSPAVWRRDERSKAASLRTLLSLASFFEPRFHRFWEARISSVASDYLPTFLECQPSLYLSLSLLDRGIRAKNNEIVCVSFRDDQIRASPLVFPISRNANERVANAANFARNSITTRAWSLSFRFERNKVLEFIDTRTRVNYR